MVSEDLEMVKVSVEKVESDDYGDTQWHWHAVWRRNGHVVLDDYFRKRPSDTDLIRVLQSAKDEAWLSRHSDV